MANTLALPLAVASFGLGVLIAAPAKSEPTNAQMGGIITGEVLCSLYRAGVSPELASREAVRITKQLVDAGLLTERDAPEYKRVVQSVFNQCPEVRLPDA